MSADRALGFLLVALGALAIWSAQSLEVPFAADPLGPRGFPTVVAGVMAACGALLALRPAGTFERPERLSAPPLLVAAMVAYALLLEPSGFLAATAGLAACVALLFGARALPAVAVGAATSVALWLLFDRLLDLPLPKGPF
jgi:putative tricarboxylic transport membrane protein